MQSTDALTRAWNHGVGSRFGPLPGSHVVRADELPRARRLIVDVARRGQSDGGIRMALRSIAAELSEPLEHVWLGAHWPLKGGTAVRAAVNWIEVVVDDGQLRRARVPFPRRLPSTSAPGRIALGPMLAGSGTAEWTLWDQDGTYSGVVVGGAGTGAMNAIGVLAVGARAACRVPTLFVRPDSHPPERELFAPVSVGRTVGFTEMIARCEGLAAVRQGDSCCRPRIVMVIKDATPLFSAMDWRERQRFAEIVPSFEQVGVGVVARVRDLSLDAFGGSWRLRRALTSRNVLMMGSASTNALGPVAPELRRPVVCGQELPCGVGRMAGRRPLPHRMYHLAWGEQAWSPDALTGREAVEAFPDRGCLPDEVNVLAGR